MSQEPQPSDGDVEVTRLVGVDRLGWVTIPDDLDVGQHEIDTAYRLAAVGIPVRFNEIVHGDGIKNIDVTIDGALWELKSPQGASRNTIAHQWSRAKAQGADRLVIDMARTLLPDDAVLSELCRRLAGDDQMARVLHVAHSGAVTLLTRRRLHGNDGSGWAVQLHCLPLPSPTLLRIRPDRA